MQIRSGFPSKRIFRKNVAGARSRKPGGSTARTTAINPRASRFFSGIRGRNEDAVLFRTGRQTEWRTRVSRQTETASWTRNENTIHFQRPYTVDTLRPAREGRQSVEFQKHIVHKCRRGLAIFMPFPSRVVSGQRSTSATRCGVDARFLP